MKVAYFTGLRAMESGDAPAPTLTRPKDVLVRIDCVGICGSDVHYYAHGRIGSQIVQYPATLGHECAGTIVEVGDAVTRLRPGDRVAIDPAISCGVCDQCRAGRLHTCRNIQFLGSPGQAPGAVAEYHVLPAANCYPVPDTMTLAEAALVEPLSIGLHAVRLGDLAPAMRIGILGAGPIGLSVLLCAKATVPCTVYATDLLPERLAVARRCGADWTGNPPAENVVAAVAAQQAHGLDRVFECSGDPACIDQAIELLTPGGKLMLVGIPATSRVSFDMQAMRGKELTLQNVRRQNGRVATVLDMISEGQIDPTPLLTHRFPLAQIREAFELVAEYRDGVIKAIVELRSDE